MWMMAAAAAVAVVVVVGGATESWQARGEERSQQFF